MAVSRFSWHALDLVLLAILSGVCDASLPPELTEFSAQAQQASKRYGVLQDSPEFKRLLAEGRISQANDRLAALVPDAQKTATDYFVLGNLFFRMDDARAIGFMRKAEAAQPDNTLILYERAMEEHRRGDCKTAIGYYERVQRSSFATDVPALWAYSTHCYLRLGRRAEALAAWAKVDFARHHTGIETAMYEIFGPVSPNVRRETLANAVRAGRKELLCDVLLNDKEWEFDWWNVRENRDYTAADRQLAARLLAPGSADARSFELCDTLDTLSDSALLERLAAAGVWNPTPGGASTLPASPALARAVIRRLTDKDLVAPAALLGVYAAPLKARAQAQPDAPEWIDLLAYFYEATKAKPQLQAVDADGWHRLHRVAYAESYVLHLDPTSPEMPKALAAALAEFPDSSRLQAARLRRLMGTPDANAALDPFVAAQFAHVADPATRPLSAYMLIVARPEEFLRQALEGRST